MTNRFVGTICAVVVCIASVRAGRVGAPVDPRVEPGFSTPIEHVVVIDQENHSFDNVLGRLCVEDARCDGATTGETAGGQVSLATADDVVPTIGHSVRSQAAAIDGGKMDGFEQIGGCESGQCLIQYEPTAIPSVAALARSGVIADRYFSNTNAPSFGSHLFFTNQTLDGLTGNNP